MGNDLQVSELTAIMCSDSKKIIKKSLGALQCHTGQKCLNRVISHECEQQTCRYKNGTE